MRSLPRPFTGGAPSALVSAKRPTRGCFHRIACQSQKTTTEASPKSQADKSWTGLGDIGDLLGPIGLSYSANTKESKRPETEAAPKSQADTSRNGLGDIGDLLGPIGLSYSANTKESAHPEGATTSIERNVRDNLGASTSSGDEEASVRPSSIHSMTTEEWRSLYEKDGTNDLWLEDEFNAGSRLMGGRAVHKGGVYGFRTGEGPSAGDVPRHKVKIFDHYGNQEIDIEVPEDRYILWEAEDNGLELPYACRMGCCTACAVRVKEGSVYQPEALGISQELRDQGYALMCVGFPTSDAVIETVTEDEIYDLQFGQYFAAQALDPGAETIARDDYALSIANMDE